MQALSFSTLHNDSHRGTIKEQSDKKFNSKFLFEESPDELSLFRKDMRILGCNARVIFTSSFAKPLNNLLKTILIVFSFTAGICLNAQEQYFFKNYGVGQGLGSSKVYTILQDSSDLIWLGTETGLSKFNGIGFDNYTELSGLAPNGVYSLFEDMDGNIWMGHLNGGISFYDGEKFREIKIDSLTISGDITSFQQLSKDTFWITTSSDGVIKYAYNPKINEAKVIQQYSGHQGISAQVFGSYVDNEGKFFCLTDGGIKLYQPEEDSLVRFHPKGLTNYFLTITMLQDSHGDYWFGTYNGGLYRYLPNTDTVYFYDYQRHGHAGNWISSLQEDLEGNIWIGTWGRGISKFHNGRFTVYNTDNGLNAEKIKDIITDNEGNILIASYAQGMHIFQGEYLVNLVSDKLFPFSNKSVNAIQRDNTGKYWLGTNNGIVVYKEGDEEPYAIFNAEKNAIANEINFIVKDAYGDLWFASDKTIVAYSFRSEHLAYYPSLNENFRGYTERNITALACDGANLWIGTDEGLVQWGIDSKQAIGYYSQSEGLGGGGNHIKSIIVDEHNKVLVATENKTSICTFNPDSNNFSSAMLNQFISITCMAVDKDEIIWLGTTQGVYAYDNNGFLLNLTEEDGLLNNVITSITTDEFDRLYIGTSNGLNVYYPRMGKVYTYTKNSGYIGIETKKNAFYKDTDNKLWIGTANGVAIVSTDKFKTVQTDPIVHIKNFLVEKDTITVTEGLKFNHKQNDIEFEYYIVSLKNPDAVLYQVMLEGLDEDWRPASSATTEDYQKLNPGKYTFKVRARNSDGVWGSITELPSFIIKPPFTQSKGFLISASVFIILAFVGFFQIRTRNLRREKQKLEKLVRERTAEVVKKSEEIELKNKDIMASIRYAERIQKALLPDEKLDVERFVIYRPKEHVSGDFYWMHKDKNANYIAAVDCTGHGVPGAFMSIIGHDSLNKIIKENQITQPALILDELNNEIYKSLIHNGGDDIKDGMDLAFVAFKPEENLLEFAGAHNPLWRLRNGELEEIKANRFAIGMTTKQSGHKFTNHSIEVEKGDVFYIFTDGYADQFGGGEGKKYKKANLKRKVTEICNEPMQTQKEILEKTFEDWKGSEEQIDDVLLIGFKV